MFRGIIEEIGTILATDRQPGHESTLTIASTLIREGAKIGDHIGVNGVSLSITALDDEALTVALPAAILDQTTLIQVRVGAPVNLERASSTREDGEASVVEGRVDDVGAIVGSSSEGEALLVMIHASDELLPAITPNDSITVDGARLPVVSCLGNTFTVVLDAALQQATMLGRLPPGEIVNLELDQPVTT